jgi:hypothetical protein
VENINVANVNNPSESELLRTTLRYSQSTAERISALAGKVPTAVFLRDLIMDGLDRLEGPPEEDGTGADDGVADVVDSVSRLAVQVDQLRQEVAKLAAVLAGQQQQFQAVTAHAGKVAELTGAVTQLLAQVELEDVP